MVPILLTTTAKPIPTPWKNLNYFFLYFPLLLSILNPSSNPSKIQDFLSQNLSKSMYFVGNPFFTLFFVGMKLYKKYPPFRNRVNVCWCNFLQDLSLDDASRWFLKSIRLGLIQQNLPLITVGKSSAEQRFSIVQEQFAANLPITAIVTRIEENSLGTKGWVIKANPDKKQHERH